jgi:UDP-N-acetylmuramyl pentapeptide phosphotransferase/UDP-N-acetylglucosamine-1-phosphate transferase
MFSFFISFVAAAVIILLIIRLARTHGFALDSDLTGVQKVHARAVPRIGGVGIFSAVVIGGLVAMWREPTIGKGIFLLLSCSAVAFLGGIVEDFTRRVSPGRRLLLTMIAAARRKNRTHHLGIVGMADSLCVDRIAIDCPRGRGNRERNQYH